jgi:hypothetical protein
MRRWHEVPGGNKSRRNLAHLELIRPTSGGVPVRELENDWAAVERERDEVLFVLNQR